MTPRTATYFDTIPTWLVVLLAVAWILPGLVGHEPWKPDEAYSFGLVYHILQTGDWVVPTLAGEPFMEKPPLFYLTAALFAKLFSPWLPLHDGAHLAAGFYMALTLLFTGLAARELYGRGIAAALALLACLGLAPLAHALITDLGLLAGLTAGLYGLALARRRQVLGGILLGTGAGAAFLSKGLIGPGLIGLVTIALPLLSREWRTRQYFSCLITAAVAALPWLLIWPVALYRHSPDLFMTWLWDNNFGRFLGSSGLGPKQEALFYLRTLPWFAWPAWLLAAGTVWLAGRRGLGQPGVTLPLTALALSFLVLTGAADARQVYALPLLPPLALLAVPALGQLPRWLLDVLYGLGILVAIAVVALVWATWSAIEFGVPALLADYFAGPQAELTPGGRTAAVAIAVLYSVGAFVLLYATRRTRERPVIAWAVVTTLALGLMMTLLLEWLDARKGYHQVMASLKQSMPASYRCVVSDGLGESQRAMLDYYAGIKTHRLGVTPVTNCDLLLRQEPADAPASVDEREWRLIWQGARLADEKERFRLYQRTL